MPTVNSFGTRAALTAGPSTSSGQAGSLQYYSLPKLQATGFPEIERLPYSMKILLENLLRHEDGRFVKATDVEALAKWDLKSGAQKEISFAPARVLLQDFTGVPAVVDLAAMRDGIARLGGDPNKVNPLQPVELVRRARVLTQQGALRVSPLGPERVPQFPGRPARHRHRPSGEPGVPGTRDHDVRRSGRDDCVPRHTRRHRLAHDDGERSRRRRLGRGRHRGGSGDARAADLDADSAGARLPLEGRDASSSSATASRISRSPTAPRSATCVRNTARRSRSFRSTT